MRARASGLVACRSREEPQQGPMAVRTNGFRPAESKPSNSHPSHLLSPRVPLTELGFAPSARRGGALLSIGLASHASAKFQALGSSQIGPQAGLPRAEIRKKVVIVFCFGSLNSRGTENLAVRTLGYTTARAALLAFASAVSAAMKSTFVGCFDNRHRWAFSANQAQFRPMAEWVPAVAMIAPYLH